MRQLTHTFTPKNRYRSISNSPYIVDMVGVSISSLFFALDATSKYIGGIVTFSLAPFHSNDNRNNKTLLIKVKCRKHNESLFFLFLFQFFFFLFRFISSCHSFYGYGCFDHFRSFFFFCFYLVYCIVLWWLLLLLMSTLIVKRSMNAQRLQIYLRCSDAVVSVSRCFFFCFSLSLSFIVKWHKYITILVSLLCCCYYMLRVWIFIGYVSVNGLYIGFSCLCFVVWMVIYLIEERLMFMKNIVHCLHTNRVDDDKSNGCYNYPCCRHRRALHLCFSLLFSYSFEKNPFTPDSIFITIFVFIQKK